MWNQERVKDSNERISTLMGEVLRGEHKKDILVNSSYDFGGERQATYFSRARNNLYSDMAHEVFETHQEISDIHIMKELLKNE